MSRNIQSSNKGKFKNFVFTGFLVLVFSGYVHAAEKPGSFTWPEGKKAALSLSFDDARESQLGQGRDILSKYKVKATFYVLPGSVEQKLEGWKQIVTDGHEIGNHTLHHPCSENFDWVKPGDATEDYTLERMRAELVQANTEIVRLLGKTPVSFAYPCGETAIGKGLDNKSYVPLVAELFQSGRGWQGETSNDPGKIDLAQILGMKMDNTDFSQLLPALEEASKKSRWVVLAGHEIGDSGEYTTRQETLEKIIRYAQNPENKIWLAPVGVIADYVKAQKEHK